MGKVYDALYGNHVYVVERNHGVANELILDRAADGVVVQHSPVFAGFAKR